MVEQRNQRRDWRERFAGFRVNCESIPRLPASALRPVIDDPRGLSYLLIWRDRFDWSIREALRVISAENSIELKRPDRSCQRVQTDHSELPHGGTALLLFCPCCSMARRHLYGWSILSQRVVRFTWQCRTCAGLRYRSEGSYVPRMFRCFGGGYPRTEPWDPFVFSSPREAAKYFPELGKPPDKT
jgi:hypothetical protein